MWKTWGRVDGIGRVGGAETFPDALNASVREAVAFNFCCGHMKKSLNIWRCLSQR